MTIYLCSQCGKTHDSAGERCPSTATATFRAVVDDAALYEIDAAIRATSTYAIVAANARQERASREQTAATILAALTTDRMVADGDQTLDANDGWNIRYAVRLADALRAELAKGTP